MLSVSFAGSTGPLAPNVLACFRSLGEGADDPRVIRLDARPLGDRRCDELWTVATPVETGTRGRFFYARSADYLFGHTRVSDEAMDDAAGATAAAYADLAALLREQGFPALLRSWNYIGDIHQGAGDAERYKQFCLGRHRVVAATPDYERTLPAATVIGTAQPGLLLCFLAGRQPGQQVENPRQTSAFRYPRQYGPASPSFSRAIIVDGGRLLLMSGTASVVGHATRHPHDTAAQLDEMLANVQALLQHASERHSAGAAWSARVLRLFLRDAAELPLAQARLRRAFGADAPIAFMEGDICRGDLRVEIEGVYAPAQPAPA